MVTIRPTKEEDAPLLHALLDSVCRERRYLAMLAAPPLERVAKFVGDNARGDLPQFVAFDEGQMVGWCDAIPGEAGEGRAHVARLGMGIAPSRRRQGIGYRLMVAIIQKCRVLGLEKIELSVYASNAPAIALYRKLGFVEEGRRKRGRLVDGVHDDVVLMALPLR